MFEFINMDIFYFLYDLNVYIFFASALFIVT